MTGKVEEQEKNKPRREKARVSESKKLIERRKSSSDGLFMLERDLSLDGSLTEPKSKNYLYLPSKVTVRIFPPIKVRKFPPLDYHRTVERGKHRAARI